MTGPDPSRLPDPGRSRAVVIGSATYDDAAIADLPSAARSAQALHNVLTDPARGGLAAAHCRLIIDPRNAVEVVEAIAQAAAEAEDLLLVYFVGHGLRGRDGAVHLAVRESRKSLAQVSAVPLGPVKDAFASRAATRIFLVDSCFSAQAIKEMMGGDPFAEAPATFDGIFVGTSADQDKTASAPVGERYTAFTGALLDVMHTGLAGGGDVLTYHDALDMVRRRLVADGRPEPHFGSRDQAGRLGLVRNAAAGAPSAAVAPKPERIVFSSAYRMVNRALSTVLITAVLVIMLSTYDTVHQQFSLVTWIAVAPMLLSLGVRERFPAELTLIVDDQGLALRIGTREHRVGWLNVAQVTLTQNYDLRVRLLPGAALRPAPWWRLGPRRTESADEYVLLRTRQLAATPDAVDDALRAFAGHAWLRNRLLDEQRTAERTQFGGARVFRTARGRYVLLGAVFTTLGLTPLLALLWTPPPLAMVIDAAAALVAVAPGLFLLLCAWHPAELLLDADGLRMTRFGRLREFTWDAVEKVSLIRPGRLPLTPWHLHLRLASGEVTLLDTISLSTRRSVLAAALATRAGGRWDPVRRPDHGVLVQDDAVRITGRVLGLPTMIAPVLLLAALFVGVQELVFMTVGSDTLGGPADALSALIVTGVPLWSVLPLRQRWTLTLTSDGLEIRVWRRRIRIRWDDVRHVRLAAVETAHPSRKKAKPAHHTEIRIVPNREGAFTRSWRLPLFLVPVHDVYRLCVLDNVLFHLDASIDTVDRELRRHAGPECWRPRTEVKP